MILDSGVIFICVPVNLAEDGLMPVDTLQPIDRQWYAERTVGLSRQYSAKGVSEQVDMLVRIHYNKRVRIGMYGMLAGTREQFRITNVQQVDEDGLRYTDLTLMRLEHNYDVAGQTI